MFQATKTPCYTNWTKPVIKNGNVWYKKDSHSAPVPASTEPFWVDDLQHPTMSKLARAQVPEYEHHSLQASDKKRMSDDELLQILTHKRADLAHQPFLSHVAAYVITEERDIVVQTPDEGKYEALGGEVGRLHTLPYMINALRNEMWYKGNVVVTEENLIRASNLFVLPYENGSVLTQIYVLRKRYIQPFIHSWETNGNKIVQLKRLDQVLTKNSWNKADWRTLQSLETYLLGKEPFPDDIYISDELKQEKTVKAQEQSAILLETGKLIWTIPWVPLPLKLQNFYLEGVQPSAIKLVIQQKNLLPDVKKDLYRTSPKTWVKKSHWAWYVWPTPLSEKNDLSATAVVNAADINYVLWNDIADTWISILEKLATLLRTQGNRNAIPENDHERVNYFIETWGSDRYRAEVTKAKSTFTAAFDSFKTAWENTM